MLVLAFIGYASATLGALQVLAAYEADRGAAISRYRSALRMGAAATEPELLSRAGATFAFDLGPLPATVDALMNSLERTREGGSAPSGGGAGPGSTRLRR